MKTKPASNSKVRKQKILNAPKPNVNLKNREQLRKKLKGLFDKSNLHLLAAENKFTSTSPKISHALRQGNNNADKIKNKTKSQNSIANTKTQKQKDTPNVPKTKANAKSKSIGKPIKRKFEGKLDTPKKAFKRTKSSSNAKPKIKKQNTNLIQTANNNDSKQKADNDKGRKKNKKSLQMHTENETKSDSKQNHTKNIKKTFKTQKTNIRPYRGPFRPPISKSNSHESFQNTSSKKIKVKPVKFHQLCPNNEQALTRVTHENYSSRDGNCEDPDYDPFVDFGSHDENSDDGNDSYEYDNSSTNTNSIDSYDEDFSYDNDYSNNYSFSEGSLFMDSESDNTYELPENVAEDVYILNGSAVKHDISASNEVNFDSDTSCAQIIEMPTSPITQQNDHSIRKTLLTVSNGRVPNQSNKYESDDSCPELVPIESESHIHHDTDSDCCSDCMLFSGSDSKDDSSSEENNDNIKPPQMTPVIFQADITTKEELDVDIFQVRNTIPRSYTNSSPLNRIKNSKGNTTSYKVITTNNQVVAPTFKIKKPRPQKKQPNSTSSSRDKDLLPSCDVTPIMTKIKENQSETPTTKRSIDTLVSNSSTETKPTPNTSEKKSPFRTLFFNAINSNHVIVLVKDPLFLYGTVKLKLIAGSVDIFGYAAKRNEPLEIFSPRGYSSLKIESTKSTGANASATEKDLFSLTPYFIRTDLEEVIEKFDSTKDAIVILERNDRSKKVNMLRKYMIENLFPNMNSIQSDRPFYASEFLLRCIITANAEKGIILDPRWRSIKISKNSRVMAIGGKSVGKSTLVRYLINTNLNNYPKMVLIDLDIGQPEIFVPQTVSVTTLIKPLLGPGYFLNKEPDKAFLVGQTNIVLLPQRYIESVKALLEFCKANKEYEGIPWIVNTMGYNKGFGDELIVIICNLLNPTNIIQLECQREINNFDVIMSKDNLHSLECNIVGDMFSSNTDFCSQHNLTLIPSVITNDIIYQNERDMNPRDVRHAVIVSRLSTILIGHAEWLTDIKPVCASIDDLQIIHLGDDQMNTEDLVKTLAGNLIYLCRQKPCEATECLGIGIVRGVDYSLKQVYLLPAIPLEMLENVNCLAICGIPLPSSILINQGPKVRGVASYVYNTVDKASSMYIKQIYHRPEHFLTGMHKTVLG